MQAGRLRSKASAAHKCRLESLRSHAIRGTKIKV